MITLSGFHYNRPEILLINSLEGRQLVNVQKDPWKVADEEDHDDRQEDDGQAVFLSPQESDVLRVVAVDVLDVVEARATARRLLLFGRIRSGLNRI